MAEDEEEENEDELPSVDHGPINEGPWEKDHFTKTNRRINCQEEKMVELSRVQNLSCKMPIAAQMPVPAFW